MGVYAGDIADLIKDRDASADSDPLGTRLRGRAAGLDIDPVEAVREIREDDRT